MFGARNKTIETASPKGATAVMGSKSLLVLLRGPRLGELAVMDPKSLAEKRAIKLPWCEAGGSEKKSAENDKSDE